MKIKRSTLVFLLILLAFSTFATAGMWSLETIDSADSVGTFTSLALDSQEIPHIAYYDPYEQAVKYINLKSRSAQTVASTIVSDTWISLDIDTKDTPHIIYYDFFYTRLKYAKLEGKTWVLKDVDTGGVGQLHNAIVLDGKDVPHVSYYDADNKKLKYAYYDSVKALWRGQVNATKPDVVDTSPDVGQYTSIAVDSLNYPYISYYDATDKNLKYAMWNGTAWKIATLDSDGTVGLYTSIAVDKNNYVHISYQYDDGATKQYLKYIKLKDTTIGVLEGIDQAAGYVGFFTSIAVDSNNCPHISYYDQADGALKYARYIDYKEKWGDQIRTDWKIENGWFIQTVDTTGNVGKFSSIALDNRNHPHISYYDATGRDLEYATIP